jgi:hypothetical protein
LGQAEGPETSTETRPPWFMTACKTLLLVSLLAKPHGMLTHSIWRSQINGNQWPGCSLGGTPSLPHGVASPIKPPTHSSQAAALWTWEGQPSSLCFNKSFFSTHGVVFVWQFLTVLKKKDLSAFSLHRVYPNFVVVIEKTTHAGFIQEEKNSSYLSFFLNFSFSLLPASGNHHSTLLDSSCKCSYHWERVWLGQEGFLIIDGNPKLRFLMTWLFWGSWIQQWEELTKRLISKDLLVE